MGKTQSLYEHATTVEIGGRGLMIRGPSGAGKSDLALGLIALGARLVSDDQTRLDLLGQRLFASCPRPALRGQIEARGLGILRVDSVFQAPLDLILDLGVAETLRLPPIRYAEVLGQQVALVLRPQTAHLAQTIYLLMKKGRIDPDQ